jgi:fructan beta-fructosidase
MKTLTLALASCSLLWACGPNQQAVESSSQAIAAPAVSEQHRPLFHFTPPAKWMNDPNGMVFFEGEYHLFYQYYPDSTIWGPMHWGHAISTDLVHWEHLPVALYPDERGYIFSGSAVADLNNTSGLGSPENPPLVAIFTYHDPEGERAGRTDYQTQGIAYSLDKGRSWQTYENNPVLANPGIRDFRDPKVMWHDQSQKWIMALAVDDRISFYSSPNLKEWQHESDFGADIGAHGGVWECPDLFKMKVEGSSEEKWVLLVSINPGAPNGGSGTQYFVGQFDGRRFTLDNAFRRQLTAEIPLPRGQVFADFEGGSYGGWTAEGEAFGTAPASGRLGDQQPVRNFMGRGLVNSFLRGDATTGTLRSPDFTIESRYINLLVGGGNHPEGTAVHLLVNGKRVRSETGRDSEQLDWRAWDVAEFRGQQAHIEIVDRETGGWGHILVDHIFFSEQPAQNSPDGIWIDWGRDNYAGVTWSNVPEEDGRRLFIGWMSNWAYANVVPTESWRSAMTVVRNLQLENTPAGLRLVSTPVQELEKLYGQSVSLPAQPIADSLNITEALSFNSPTFALRMELEGVDPATGFVLELSNSRGQMVLIGYDPSRQAYFTDRRAAGNHDFSANFGGIHYGPRLVQEQLHRLELLVDVASLELFADGGKTVMTDIFFPDEPFTQLRLLSKQGGIRLRSGSLTALQSIYQAQN